MALSNREKIKLQSIIEDNLESLNSGKLSNREKIKLQSEIEDALEKLNEAIDSSPDTASENEKLKTLLQGGYRDKEPLEFLKILREIVDEINDLDPTKPGIIDYIRFQKAA